MYDKRFARSAANNYLGHLCHMLVPGDTPVGSMTVLRLGDGVGEGFVRGS